MKELRKEYEKAQIEIVKTFSGDVLLSSPVIEENPNPSALESNKSIVGAYHNL